MPDENSQETQDQSATTPPETPEAKQDAAPPEGQSVVSDELDFEDKPEHPLGSVAIAKANGLGDVHAAAYANHFRKLRAEGKPELHAHAEAARKTDPDAELSFVARSVLRNDEVIVQPGERVSHLDGNQLVDLLSRDAVGLV